MNIETPKSVGPKSEAPRVRMLVKAGRYAFGYLVNEHQGRATILTDKGQIYQGVADWQG